MLLVLVAPLFACGDDDGGERGSRGAISDGAVADAQTAAPDAANPLDATIEAGLEPDGATTSPEGGAPDASLPLVPDAGSVDGSVLDAGQPLACLRAAAPGMGLLDLGYSEPVPDPSEQQVPSTVVRGDRLLTYSTSDSGSGPVGSWAVWNTETLTKLGQQTFSCAACDSSTTPIPQGAFGDGLLAITDLSQTRGHFDLYAPSDMRLLASVYHADAVEVGAAVDGGYVFTAASDGLRIWSPLGTMLSSRSWEAGTRSFFAAPGVLRIVGTVANAVESVDVATGDSTTIPYSGTFAFFFSDESGRFATTGGSTLRVYEADGTLTTFVPFAQVPRGGWGPYVWSTSALSRVSDASALLELANDGPAPRVTSGRLLTGSATVLDLRSDPPVAQSVAAQSPALITDADRVIWTGSRGELFGGRMGETQRRAFACGAVLAGDLNESGAWVLATSAGQVVTGLTAGPQVQSVIEATAESVKLAPDGQHLIVATSEQINLYDRTSGALVRTIGSTAEVPAYRFLDAGELIGFVRCQATDCQGRIEDRAGALHASWKLSPTFPPAHVTLSPSGRRVAISVGSNDPVFQVGTQIFSDGTLVGAVDGVPFTWLGEDRLVVLTTGVSGGGSQIYGVGVLVDATGAEQARTPDGYPSVRGRVIPLPSVKAIAGSTLVLASANGLSNRIIDATTAMDVWAPTKGAIWAADAQRALVAEGALVSLVNYP